MDPPTANAPIPPCVLLLNAFPGTGKLTIARARARALSTLLHNHLLIDPVSAIHPRRDKAHYVLRRAFRKAAFDASKSGPEGGDLIVWGYDPSGCLGASDADVAVLAEHVDVARARARKVPFILVNLVCEIGGACGEVAECGEEGEEGGSSGEGYPMWGW
ncbi:uncharacterized protein BDZ99DRAFT_571369 [Mytilinidion resinicola]|uniref:P-loop containing nucleoside triphosphate hydrolase protein n=1 Tax=Mytilinidion resinicola TaxID=574789 RepID=A0A6A6YM16_9PEZI|nr:uncharacterized protein BDZ99DRAFT_571369 [Mytilinidion resinicola]KAF2809578.1 hypothetical protein BDZ99DRAFT_571369 [Mytilinidion resinicola]